MGKVSRISILCHSFSLVYFQERPHGRVLPEVHAGDAEGDPGAGGGQHGAALTPHDAPGQGSIFSKNNEMILKDRIVQTLPNLSARY